MSNAKIVSPSDHDIYSEDSSASCDRRLGRAARAQIRRRVLQAVSSKDDLDGSVLLQQEELDVWMLLDQWLGKAPPSCPLLPNNDLLRQDEEQSLKVKAPSKNLNLAYPTHVLQQRRQSSPLRPQEWYQCGYCGKTFATRFYLDLHMDEHHQYHSTDDNLVCPAEWCRVVGLANCHQQALEDEPFYDRGSGGWGEDRKLVQHKWKKVAHAASCNLESVQADCRSVLHSCGLSGDFCDSIICPTHHFVWMDHWRDTWLQEAQHHPGMLGILIIVAIGIWVYTQVMPSVDFMSAKPHLPGRRLLQKSPQPRGSRYFIKRAKRD